jgi:hypothetical protein
MIAVNLKVAVAIQSQDIPRWSLRGDTHRRSAKQAEAGHAEQLKKAAAVDSRQLCLHDTQGML